MKKRLKNFTLELSAKAFKDNSEKTMYGVCQKMFAQWNRATSQAEQVSVMLWLADGSEILQYSGNLDDTFEWAYWMGTANPDFVSEEDTRDLKYSLSHNPVHYRDDITPRTYAWIKRLLEVIKEVGGPGTRVGATFDPGPEFAISKFKTETHTECMRKIMGINAKFIKVNSLLNADSFAYAGFPDGIPQGTSFGHFLGRQFHHFAHDLGFDYLWLSNGIGFGFETWRIQGALFDGKNFYPERTTENHDSILEFWNELSRELQEFPVETRGSNLSAGIEMASDAAPIKEIYERFHPTAPVNSPWAALNFDTGVELAGWMSHIAEPPSEIIPFRYYIHDPWWVNSPWLDRYEREPWDIYMPLSVASLDGNGMVRTANSVSLLSVDNSYGDMPEQVPDEVIPHLLEALEHRPDQCGPLLWLYPFEEYHQQVFGRNRCPQAVLAEDAFISASIQNGLPLNTVISSDAFLRKQPDDTLLIVPVSAMRGDLLSSVSAFIDKGEKVLFYGPLSYADEALRERLGIKLKEEISGCVTVQTRTDFDSTAEGTFHRNLTIYPQICGGGLCEECNDGIILAEAVQGSEKRVLAMAKGSVAWVRSLLTSIDEPDKNGRIISAAASEQFPVQRLTRSVLGHLGFYWMFHSQMPDQAVHKMNISRYRNAFYFSGTCPDSTVEQQLRMPLGVPVLTGMDTMIRDGKGYLRMPRSWHKECRLFVESCNDCIVSAHERTVGYPGRKRHLEYSGLKNATIHFLADPDDPSGKQIVTMSNVNGNIDFIW